MGVDASGTGRGCYPRGSLVASRLVAAPDVTVVVLTWNTRDLTRTALAAVAAAAAPFACQTICVDNASRDGTAEAVRAHLPAVEVIRLASNLGFARGNDAALPHARGRVIVFLNSDTEARPGSLAHVVRYLDAHPAVGIAVPSLVGTGRGARNARRGANRPSPPRSTPTPRSAGSGSAAPPSGANGETARRSPARDRSRWPRARAWPSAATSATGSGASTRATRSTSRTSTSADGPAARATRSTRSPTGRPSSTTAAPPRRSRAASCRISLLQGLLRFHRQGLDPRAYAWFSPALRAGVVARSLAEILRAPVTWALRRLRGRPERAARAIDTARQRATFLERDVLRWLRVETGTRATSSPGAPGPGRRR